jgi:hypothetical protein
MLNNYVIGLYSISAIIEIDVASAMERPRVCLSYMWNFSKLLHLVREEGKKIQIAVSMSIEMRS